MASVKNHLRPTRRAKVRMRAESPVKRRIAGRRSAHSVPTIHSTFPLRW